MTEQEKRLSEHENSLASARDWPVYYSVSQIPMHITPWWKDENGIPTRQIWAVGSVIER